LLQTTPALFMVIKYAGAAYLAWVGIGLLRSSVSSWFGKGEAEPKEVAVDASRPFRTALVISLMNPKAILFFVSFFVQFVDPGYAHPALSFLILGAIVQVFSALYLSVLIFSGSRLAAQFRRRRKLSAAATGGVGGVFIGFGAKLATATLG
jgi:leucine efflux protein